MKKRTSRISVYDYTDFRKYLVEFYNDAKSANSDFSYRYFATRAGFNSSGLYKDIADGRRNMNRGLIIKFAKGLGLDRKETDYFENLVYFTQSKSIEEQKRYFERLLLFRKSKAALIEADKYEFFSEWYYLAVRELFSIRCFKDDYMAIGKALNPQISPAQARKAVEVLLKLGFIKKDSGGHYKPTQSTLTTGDEVKSLNVANFQKATMRLAYESIDRHPARQRNVSTLTLSISKDTFDFMNREITAFRKKLLELADSDKILDRVYQLNIQFFPLSRIEG